MTVIIFAEVLMQKILSNVRKAIANYHLITDGDVIAVGVSGGKDSMAMLYALYQLKKYSILDVTIHAIYINVGFDDIVRDESVRLFCNQHDIPYHHIDTDIADILSISDSSPCSLCSKMRRGALVNKATQLGCNKLALGHHSDDVLTTFMLSMIYEGRLSTIQPIVSGDKETITVIRPMLYVNEGDIRGAVRRHSLPTFKNPCPHDKHTEREHMNEIISSIQDDIPIARSRIKSALLHPERNNLIPPPSPTSKD